MNIYSNIFVNNLISIEIFLNRVISFCETSIVVTESIDAGSGKGFLDPLPSAKCCFFILHAVAHYTEKKHVHILTLE